MSAKERVRLDAMHWIERGEVTSLLASVSAVFNALTPMFGVAVTLHQDRLRFGARYGFHTEEYCDRGASAVTVASERLLDVLQASFNCRA